MDAEELEKINWINAASYRDLVSRWHGARAGDSWFKGPVGYHYIETMERRRCEVGEAEHRKIYREFGIPLGDEGLGGDDV